MISIRVQHQLSAFSLDIETTIPSNGVTALFGPSGSGKTSILNMISGLCTPNDGHLQVGDDVLFASESRINLPPEERNIGYVFQDIRLFPHMTVLSNLTYGHKGDVSLPEVVSLLALDHLLHRAPTTLSGGEQQRVAIGRCLLSNPTLLLLDEPLSSLDAQTKKEFLPYLERLTQTVNLPIVYVSHNLQEIVLLAQHMLVLKHGRILFEGSPASVIADERFRPFKE